MSDTITITVIAGIGFEDLLPGSTDGNQAEFQVPSGSNLDCIADIVGLKPNEKYMTALNETVVVKSERTATVLAAGDVVEILPPLVGG